MMPPALYLPTGQKLCDLEDVSEFIRCFRKLSRMMLQEFISAVRQQDIAGDLGSLSRNCLEGLSMPPRFRRAGLPGVRLIKKRAKGAGSGSSAHCRQA